MPPVTYLFVPGNRPERFAKAQASGADAIVLDLEDAVAPADKLGARQHIAAWTSQLKITPEQLVVRINDASSPWFADDLAMIKDCGIKRVMLPKTEFGEQVKAAIAATSRELVVLPLVETARGINNIEQIALAEGVERIAFGTLDYAADLDLSGDPLGLIHPYSRIAIASRSAELAAPIAGVTPSLDDEEKIAADFAFARAFGCTAKLCIHPKQVAIVNRLSRPSPEELAWAEKVLAAAEASLGAVQVDGRMVDRPVVLKAEAIVARSRTTTN